MSCEQKFKIQSYEVQPDGCVKISALMKFFQKLAGDDLDGTKLTYENLASYNMAFVITKVDIKIFSDMKLYDNVIVTTHARPLRGATFIRDFIVRKNGEICAYASTCWVMFDLTQRTILRPSAIESLGTVPTCDDDLIELPSVRRKIDINSLSRTDVRKVKYSLLDMNNHLNNTYYADFIFDCIPYETHKSDAGMFIHIEYKTEGRLGDEIEMFMTSDASNGEFDIVANNSANGKICFNAYVSFDKK